MGVRAQKNQILEIALDLFVGFMCWIFVLDFALGLQDFRQAIIQTQDSISWKNMLIQFLGKIC